MCIKQTLISLFILLGIWTKSTSQTKFPDAETLSKSKCLDVTIDSISSLVRHSFPYSAIVVSDQRFDTAYAGYHYSRNRDKLTKICIKGNAEKEISSFLNRYYEDAETASSDTIFIQVKKLWIKNEEAFAYKYYATRDSRAYSIHLKTEFYLKRESCYYALYRFDSIFYLKGKPDETASILTRKALIASTVKLLDSELTVKVSRCLPFARIDSFNNAYKNIPALKETTPKGVYLTFNQFKNNQPAYTDFELSLAEAVDAIFVKGKTLKDSSIIDAWGFSDGKNVYIRRNKNFFLLFKAGDNFEFYGFDEIRLNTPFGDPGYSRNDAFDRPYHLPGRYSADVYSYNADRAGSLISSGLAGLTSRIISRSKDMSIQSLDMETGKVN